MASPMTEEELIEKQAKAIYEDRNGTLAKPWRSLPTAHKAPYRSDARAALTAIREAGIATVRRDDLERVREILWERGESETEDGPLWLVRAMLTAGDDA